MSVSDSQHFVERMPMPSAEDPKISLLKSRIFC
jgi:hypothetical protein